MERAREACCACAVPCWAASGCGDLVLVEECHAQGLGRSDAEALGRGLAEVGRDVGQQVEGTLRRGAGERGDGAQQAEREVTLLAQLGHVGVQLAPRCRVGPRLECGDAGVLRDRRGAPAAR
eukprot:scaffold123177_cov63-Phaeocystis_antarctica.AAC.7